MLEILFEDSEIIVCIKPAGVSSQEQVGIPDMPHILKEYLQDTTAYIGVVHRLDTAVCGVMIYAKTKSAAADLSRQMQTGEFSKEYWAVISGRPETQSGVLTDLLFKDSKSGKVFPVKRMRKGVKTAVLAYDSVSCATLQDGDISLLKIKLQTGRTHQIRVQFASRKMPLIGDKKYGSRVRCPIALFCKGITFTHPKTKEILSVAAALPNGFPWDLFPKITK